jgi:membrane protease subunit HflK
VELLFGKVIRLNEPGVHYHAPAPFGKVVRVDTGVIARVESGFRTNWGYTTEPETYLWEFMHTQGRYYKVPEEAITLTGDENLVDANFICCYQIVNPVEYALDNENAYETLRSLFNFEAHITLEHYHLDTLLTSGRSEIQEELERNMKIAVSQLPLGVKILKVLMQEVHPPIEVVPQYRAVASAREQKSEIMLRANAYANDLLPRTRGKSKASILEADGFAAEKMSISMGEAQRFLLKQGHFSQFQTVQHDRLWWETVEKALDGKSIYILPKNSKHRIYTSDKTREVDE